MIQRINLKVTAYNKMIDMGAGAMQSRISESGTRLG